MNAIRKKRQKKIRVFALCAVLVGLFATTSCEKNPYVYCIVEGRIIDKITKEPVGDVLVDFNKYDIIQPPSNKDNIEKMHKLSPVREFGESWSDANGEFRTFVRVFLEAPYPSLIYIYGIYGYCANDSSSYKDTIISVNFSNVPLSGTPSKNYKGDYVLHIGDIELEKID